MHVSPECPFIVTLAGGDWQGTLSCVSLQPATSPASAGPHLWYGQPCQSRARLLRDRHGSPRLLSKQRMGCTSLSHTSKHLCCSLAASLPECTKHQYVM